MTGLARLRRSGVLLAALSLLAGLLTACLPGAEGHASAVRAEAHSAADLTVATWNIEWLLTPATRDDLGQRCVGQQPRSHQRALPCTPGRAEPPRRDPVDFDALARMAERLHREVGAQVVALQEVDGPAAARLVFREGWRVDCFSSRAHPQKTGFAIREGTPYQCHPELHDLDIDGSSRSGADISLYPGTARELRLLSVHLKAGCHTGRLDRKHRPCERLQSQVPILERWVDERVREGLAFAVLGDFNRRLNTDARHPAGLDEAAPVNLFQALSDDEPHGAVLHRATDGARMWPCRASDTFRHYIDDILVSDSLAARARERRFVRLSYPVPDQGLALSDHCPLVLQLPGALR